MFSHVYVIVSLKNKYNCKNDSGLCELVHELPCTLVHVNFGAHKWECNFLTAADHSCLQRITFFNIVFNNGTQM